MSLEAAIAKLTEAVEANTKALLGGGGASTGGTKPAGSKPAGTKPSGTTKKTEKKGPSADDLASAFGEYLKTGDKDERAEAKANVKKIIDHFEVDRITNLDAENYQEALDLLAQFKDGEDPLGDGEEGDDDLM